MCPTDIRVQFMLLMCTQFGGDIVLIFSVLSPSHLEFHDPAISFTVSFDPCLYEQ